MQWRRHFGAVGIMARISWVSASCVDARFRATGNTQVKPQQQFRGRSEMIPKSSIMARFLLFQAQSACNTVTLRTYRPLIYVLVNRNSFQFVYPLFFLREEGEAPSPLLLKLKANHQNTTLHALQSTAKLFTFDS